MKTQSPSLNSVEKALKVLLALTTNSDGMGTGELSEELGLSKPTVSRLLNTLKEHDFVQQSPKVKKYTLGKSAFDIGRSAYKHIGSQLVPIAKPYIDSIRDTVGESALLEVMAGNGTMVVYRANGPSAVGILVRVGTRLPAHVSPGARAILAFSPPEIVDSTLKNNLTRYTPQTITDPGVLRKDLEKTRGKGVVSCFGEYDSDFNAFGAPIFDHNKKPVAAVVITIPVYRAKHHKQSRIVSLLKDTAAKISDQLLHYGI